MPNNATHIGSPTPLRYDRTMLPAPWRNDRATTHGGKVLLGKTSSATVKLAYDTVVKAPVAVKSFKDANVAIGRQEAAVLAAIRSPHVVALHRVVAMQKTKNGKTYEKLHIVMEAAPATLGEALLNGKTFDEASLRILARQLLEGVVACHAAGYVHNDLLACNIVLTPGGGKLIDVGSAVAIENGGHPNADYAALARLLGDAAARSDVDLSPAAHRFLDLLHHGHVSPSRLRWDPWLLQGTKLFRWLGNVGASTWLAGSPKAEFGWWDLEAGL